MSARILLLYTALVLLTACGGGGDFHTGSLGPVAPGAGQRGSADGATPGTLAQVASRLTKLAESDYRDTQEKWVSSREAACNHFVATALCIDGDPCDHEVRTMLADAYDTYLLAHGWEKASLSELKQLFDAGQAFDAILQNDGTKESEHGHVSIAVSMSDDGRDFEVAEGELDGPSHKLQRDGDDYIGSQRIFVRH